MWTAEDSKKLSRFAPMNYAIKMYRDMTISTHTCLLDLGARWR